MDLGSVVMVEPRLTAGRVWGETGVLDDCRLLAERLSAGAVAEIGGAGSYVWKCNGFSGKSQLTGNKIQNSYFLCPSNRPPQYMDSLFHLGGRPLLTFGAKFHNFWSLCFQIVPFTVWIHLVTFKSFTFSAFAQVQTQLSVIRDP